MLSSRSRSSAGALAAIVLLQHRAHLGVGPVGAARPGDEQAARAVLHQLEASWYRVAKVYFAMLVVSGSG